MVDSGPRPPTRPTVVMGGNMISRATGDGRRATGDGRRATGDGPGGHPAASGATAEHAVRIALSPRQFRRSTHISSAPGWMVALNDRDFPCSTPDLSIRAEV